ncbi:MAG: phosphoribosylaminoimidazolesuccinocarboxamide synthase [Verrucomicrobia bacterium]|nr:phosphoribosylaminoimidazolesuccinocarboxamide synthase [Verrucomicrobiota bacterium]
MTNALSHIEIPGLKKTRSGKVREIFDLGDVLLFVASDRLSAFDVVLPTPIPEKGRVLASLSEFWFAKTGHIVENHFITSDFEQIAQRVGRHESLRGRAMLVRKCQPLAVECIVRGYLSGSGWKEYQKTQTVCGIKLPAGLVESSKLPEAIFTPSTKAETGHDENISFEQAAVILGAPLAATVRDLALGVYGFARDYAATRGIIIADTKFEFGLLGDKVILIDEVLTPDSSRFWPADQYKPGGAQPSFDKQYVRDYLETLDWNKQYPGPVLPDEIVRRTTEKYVEALQRLTA